MFILRFRFLLILCLPLVLSCTDATIHQEQFRGAWSLETQKLPGGNTRSAPEVSGLMEWFPTSETRAHVSMSLSNDKNDIQIFESFYQLDGNTFRREDQLSRAGASTEFLSQKTDGQVSTSGAQTTLAHSDGSKFVFEVDTLSITQKNGTVETWKRIRDQKGTLAK